MRQSLFIFLLTASVSVFSVERTLKSGWNLFAPVLDASTPIETYFTQIGLPSNRVLKVWQYSSTAGWSSYTPGSSGSLTQISTGFGIWINLSTGSDVVTVLPDNRIDYKLNLDGTGWRLVSLNVSMPVSLDTNGLFKESNFSAGSLADIKKIWSFGTSWASHTPSATSNTLTQINPGYGFWVNLNTSVGLDSQNANLQDLLPPVCPGCPPITTQ